MIVPGLGVARFAGAAGPEPPSRVEDAPPETFDHRHQTGLALMPGLGYRLIVPYEEDIDCGDDPASKRVCTGRLPVFLDVQLSFGVSRRLDVLADVRFGLEEDFTGTRQFAVAPGIRYWLDTETRAKAFTAVQVVYDATEQNSDRVSDTDLGGRVGLGFMYDLSRRFGILAQTGATLGFSRWFRMELDFGLGGQVRFP